MPTSACAGITHATQGSVRAGAPLACERSAHPHGATDSPLRVAARARRIHMLTCRAQPPACCAARRAATETAACTVPRSASPRCTACTVGACPSQSRCSPAASRLLLEASRSFDCRQSTQVDSSRQCRQSTVDRSAATAGTGAPSLEVGPRFLTAKNTTRVSRAVGTRSYALRSRTPVWHIHPISSLVSFSYLLSPPQDRSSSSFC